MKKAFLLLLPWLCLASCENPFGISIPGYYTGSYSYSVLTPKEYETQGNVKKRGKTPLDYHSLVTAQGRSVLPSKGEANVLVLPIELLGSPFGPEFQADLDHALNGKAEDTGYYESVRSYYDKSSYHQSDLRFDIAPVYHAPYSASSLVKAEETKQGNDDASYIVAQAYRSYAQGKSAEELAKFDMDHDGLVDGILAVYSCLDFRHEGIDSSYYWAWVNWMDRPVEDVALQPSCYGWLSFDFLYEATGTPKVDAHCFIHEVGHMYGLDDYYAPKGNAFRPIGSFDMMSGNVVDHNAYSKYALGWVDPYVVSGPCTVTLNPSSSNGDCLLIPAKSHNGTCFDEYMLVEFYTPDGLNALDSRQRYGSLPSAFSTSGVKVYHVDARLAEIQGDAWSYVLDPTSPMETGSTREVAASNTYKKEHKADASFSLIHLMERSGSNTFVTGAEGSNATLFQQGDAFSMERFGEAFFPKKSTFNNGEPFPYTLKISQKTSSAVTVEVL